MDALGSAIDKFDTLSEGEKNDIAQCFSLVVCSSDLLMQDIKNLKELNLDEDKQCKFFDYWISSGKFSIQCNCVRICLQVRVEPNWN